LPVGSSARISAGSVTSARAVAKTQPLERLARAPLPLAASDALVEQRRRDVVDGRGPRKQVVRLEDEPDRPAAEPRQLVVVELADQCPGETVGPERRTVEAAEDVHHRALARPGRADDRDELALIDAEADVVERGHVEVPHPVDPADAFELDEWATHGVSPRPA
jgi:hypothetical protein